MQCVQCESFIIEDKDGELVVENNHGKKNIETKETKLPSKPSKSMKSNHICESENESDDSYDFIPSPNIPKTNTQVEDVSAKLGEKMLQVNNPNIVIKIENVIFFFIY
jgi:hypothetical protein